MVISWTVGLSQGKLVSTLVVTCKLQESFPRRYRVVIFPSPALVDSGGHSQLPANLQFSNPVSPGRTSDPPRCNMPLRQCLHEKVEHVQFSLASLIPMALI